MGIIRHPLRTASVRCVTARHTATGARGTSKACLSATIVSKASNDNNETWRFQMITVRRLPHNGALELSAMVRDTAGWGVWLEHTTYYGYDKAEAKRRFREHLREKHYVLVND